MLASSSEQSNSESGGVALYVRRLGVQFLNGFIGSLISLARVDVLEVRKKPSAGTFTKTVLRVVDVALFSVQSLAQQMLTTAFLPRPVAVNTVEEKLKHSDPDFATMLRYNAEDKEKQEEEDVAETSLEENSDNDEDSEDGSDLMNMLTPQEYESYSFSYQNVGFEIFHLNTSATAYDLTGQTIWPAAEVLAKYLIDNAQKLNLRESSLLELGSGAGLSGFAASFAGCPTTVVTDDSTLSVIEKLLVMNVEHVRKQQEQLSDRSVHYEPLRWGTEKEISHIRERYSKFDLVIGADTVFWPHCVIPLLQSIDELMSESGTCFLSYVERAAKTCNELLDAAQNQFNFDIVHLSDEEVNAKYNQEGKQRVRVLVLTRRTRE